MIEVRHPLSESFEPLHTDGADAPWAPRQIEVRGKRVLLVEDQQLVRAALRMILELDGHQVTEACDGAEALNLFTRGEFDLVVTDFEMPTMKGNELAAGIKLLAPSLPILMITASERAYDDVQNPVDALLNKPFTLPELRCALRKLLPIRPEPAELGVVPTLESPTPPFSTQEQIATPLHA